MELKPGYKQTEVGVIPEDWDVVKIGSISKITTGPFGTLLKASEYSVDNNGAPLVSVGEVRDGFIKITGETPRVPPSVIRRLPQYILKSGDVVFGRKGAVDRSALITGKEDGYFLGSDGISVRLHGPCNPAYVSWQLRSHRIRDWLVQNATGTTMASLNQGILKKIPLTLPPRPEQDAIASALSELDELIHGLDELVTKKRNIKQAAMQELLTGKRRLPGFEGEWEAKRLGDFAECTSGGTPTTGVSAYWGGTIRWMSSGELHLKRVTEVSGRITHAGLENSSAKLLPPRCVLIGLAGQGKTRGTAAMNLVELSTNQSIAAILPNSTFVSEYLYHSLDTRYEELRELSSGSGGRGGLNLSLIKSLRFPMPMPEEQAAISITLSDMDLELNSIEIKIAKMRELRQGLMQELLTGRIRLV